MSNRSISPSVMKVKITCVDHLERRKEMQVTLKEFSENEEYHIGIIGSPGLGKSRATLEHYISLGKKFVYVAATTPVAEDLSNDYGLEFYYGQNKTSIKDQMITIYDHLHQFVDHDNLEATKDRVLLVDEIHNTILQREFRESAIEVVEANLKHFNKVLLLTATPIDYRAYPKEFTYIQFEDNAPPLTLFATRYERNKELESIAHITAHEVLKRNNRVMIYFQNRNKRLEKLKDFIRQLGVSSISVYNSKNKSWEVEGIKQGNEEFTKTKAIKADVMITTYSDGFSVLDSDFSFICASDVLVPVAYQAMNRLRKGCKYYYLMTNADVEGEAFQELKKRIDGEIEAWALIEQQSVRRIRDLASRLAYVKQEKIFTVNPIDSTLNWAGIIRLSTLKQHEELKKNLTALTEAFAEYNVTVKPQVKYPDLKKLIYTPPAKTQILDYIYHSKEIGQYIVKQWPYDEVEGYILKLEEYLPEAEVKAFMYSEFINRTSACDEKIQQLQVTSNPKDSQLTLRLAKLFDKKKFTPEEFNQAVSTELDLLNYTLPKGKTFMSLVKGLGFTLKTTTKKIGHKMVWDPETNKETKKPIVITMYRFV